MREADKAIQMLNGFDMGDGIKLEVKVSVKPEERERRQDKLKEEEQYLSSLNCGKHQRWNAVETDPELNEQEQQNCEKNPFFPSYGLEQKLHVAGSPEELPGVGTGETREEEDEAEAGSSALGKSAGAHSLRAAMADKSSPEEKKSSSPATGLKSVKICHVCNTACSMSCAQCKTPYCGRKCQERDWPAHRLVCKKLRNIAMWGAAEGNGNDPQIATTLGNGNSTVRGEDEMNNTLHGASHQESAKDEEEKESEEEELSFAIKEKESSDGEGFDIPTPSISEVLSVLNYKPQSSNKRDDHRPSTRLPLHRKATTLTSPPAPPQTPPLSPEEAAFAVHSDSAPPRGAASSTPAHLSEEAESVSMAPTPASGIVTSHLSEDTLKGVQLAPSLCSSQSKIPITYAEIFDIFRSSSLPLSSIPLGSEPPVKLNLVVTYPVSCVRFSGVVMSVETKQALKQIQSCAASTSLPPVDPLCLVVGSKIGYVDSNADLYRMEVVKVFFNDARIDLTFYDFGGNLTLEMSQGSLVILPEELFAIPCLQLRLALSDLQVSDGVGRDYLMEVVGRAPLQITKVNSWKNAQKNFVLYLCLAHTNAGQVNVCKLVEEFLATAPLATAPLATAPPAPQTLQSMNSGLGKTENHLPLVQPLPPPPAPAGPPSTTPYSAQQPSQTKGMTASPNLIQRPPSRTRTSLNPIDSLPNQARSSPVDLASFHIPNLEGHYKLMHPAREVGHHQPPFDREFIVVPMVVNSPSSVWVQVKHPHLYQFHRMQRDINQMYSRRKSTDYSPSLGELCVVKHCEDQQYYRVEVLCVNSNGTVDVRFADFGNREMVLLSQLQHLEPVFLGLPQQALQIALDGIVPSQHALNWSDNAITYLKNKILRKEVTTQAIEQRGNVLLVSLVDPDCPQRSLSEVMVSLSHADSTKPAELKNPSPNLVGVRTSHSSSSELLPSSPVTKKLTFGQATEGGFGGTAQSLSSLSPLSPTTPPSMEGSPDEVDHNLPLLSSLGVPAEPPFQAKNTTRLQQSGSHNQQQQPIKVPSTSLPLLTRQQAVVTHVKNPGVFFVQLLNQAALSSLMELSQHLNVCSLQALTRIQLKDFCVARYADDGSMYRGQIVKVGSSPVVHFIDYGNVETVDFSEVYKLPCECASLPAQAVLCALNNTKSLVRSDPNTLDLFNSLVSGKRVVLEGVMRLDSGKSRPPKVIVNMQLETDEGERDILEIMREKGISVLPTKKSSPGRSNSSLGRQNSPSKNDKRNCQQRFLANSHPPTNQPRGIPTKLDEGGRSTSLADARGGRRSMEGDTQQESSGPVWPLQSLDKNVQSGDATMVWESPQERGGSVSPSKPPATSHPIPALTPADFPSISSVPTADFPADSEYVQVVVTDIHSPAQLHLQIASPQSLQTISDMEFGLNSHPPSPSLPSPPPTGHLCRCRFRGDGMWYRGVVTSSQGDVYNVQFIDYGNSDSVRLSDITPCPKQFLHVPRMAVKCALSGVAPPASSSPNWPKETAAFLQEKCLERFLLAKIEAREEGTGVPLVQLINTSSDSDIYLSSELIEAGLAVSPQLMSTICPGVIVTQLPEIQLPSADSFDVLVTNVASLTELYIHPISADTAHHMGTFMASITEHCSSLPPLTTPPSAGHYCLAQFSDSSWFRAKVESSLPDGKMEVLFVDYGNRETVSLSQMRPFAEKFASIPILAVRCGLCGLLPDEILSPDPTTAAVLQELATTSKMVCRILSWSPLLMDLSLPSTGKLVNVELSRRGNLSLPSPTSFFTLPAVSLPQSSFNVVIAHAEGPESFWVQLIEHPKFSQLPALMQNIGRACSSCFLNPIPARLGMLCCAQFSEDQVWYRARVISFPSSTECHVQFVDYGNFELVSVANVLPISEDLLSLPALAVHCCLVGWENKEGDTDGGGGGGGGGRGGGGRRGGGGSAEEKQSKFRSLVVNRQLMAVQSGVCGGKAVVKLVTGDVSVDQQL